MTTPGDFPESRRGASDATPPRPRHHDPGLQPERTRLAWRRTTLAGTVTAVLAGRQALRADHPGPAVLSAAVLVGLVWFALVMVAHRRMRAMAAGRPAPLPRRTALVAAGCTVALAVLGAVITF
ncbi:DUF202 domain-containing protein [Streptomyces sp. NPDC003077]|uniref:DUF202 domain-containing protein n=1 Tax=Streptomyces sp. NPDC003077 TaxID=3154443 RepID=UPI0033B26C5E